MAALRNSSRRTGRLACCPWGCHELNTDWVLGHKQPFNQASRLREENQVKTPWAETRQSAGPGVSRPWCWRVGGRLAAGGEIRTTHK